MLGVGCKDEQDDVAKNVHNFEGLFDVSIHFEANDGRDKMDGEA